MTEPVVNKTLVDRKDPLTAIKEHSTAKIITFFKTTIGTPQSLPAQGKAILFGVFRMF